MQIYSTFHPILEKQLKKLEINSAQDVIDQKKWADFLEKVSRCYYDAEQERYLLDRSMEISSREMRDLNEKLEEAQEMAHLGYWFYDKTENKMIWSKETYHLFGLDPANAPPTFEESMNFICEEDRKKVAQLIDEAFSQGKSYETVFRIKNANDKKLYWVQVQGRPNIDEIGKARVIRSISGIMIDINQKKTSELQMANLNQKLVTTARLVGMSEVATSILHNVGNILNSINIAISMIKENINNDDLKKLIQLSEIIKSNISNKDFLTEDERGKLIPDYLNSLANKMYEDKKTITNEFKSLDVNIAHIRDIVVVQNYLSDISGIYEKISLPEIINLALSMCFVEIVNKKFIIQKDYQFTEQVMLDKTKLLQVVVNLIRNAKEATITSKNPKKWMKITTKQSENKNFVELIVEDNGVGIAEEKLKNIFTFGFTTKENGHGFGLHGSAIAINEMGGSIEVKSDGIEKGAKFIVKIPSRCDLIIRD